MIQVFYHSADLDGRCCGEIARRALPSNTELVGIDYGQPFTFNPDAIKIYCLDWVPQPWVDDPRIFVIDHHKTSLGRPGIVDMSFAACELAWGYFMGAKSLPRSVQLLGQYDSWRKGPMWETDVLPFQWGMRAEETQPGSHIWYQVFADEIDSIIQLGKKILIYQEQADRIRMQRAFPLTFEGLRFIVVLGGPAGSNAFKSVWDPAKYDAMMVVEYGWKVSMYTEKPNIDLSVIAKKYGGGGHAGAAGFQPNNPGYFLGSI